jgi:hypothetical protein
MSTRSKRSLPDVKGLDAAPDNADAVSELVQWAQDSLTMIGYVFNQKNVHVGRSAEASWEPHLAGARPPGRVIGVAMPAQNSGEGEHTAFYGAEVTRCARHEFHE